MVLINQCQSSQALRFSNKTQEKVIIKFISCIFVGLAFISLLSCSRYQVTLNDNELYSPPDLITPFALADPALEACIAQTIEDQTITQVSQLKQLVCTHAGIRSLTGIEQWRALESLILKNNQLSSVLSAKNLPKLALIQLEENPNLACDQIEGLVKAKPDLEISKPVHCLEG